MASPLMLIDPSSPSPSAPLPVPPRAVVLVLAGEPPVSLTAVSPFPSQHSVTPRSFRSVTRSCSQKTERMSVNAEDDDEMIVLEVIEVMDML